MTVLAMALAAGLGAALRFVVDGLVARRVRRRVPLGTAVINVTGSFLLGLLTGYVLDHAGSDGLRLVLGTGLLGGYTTFSTASVEAVNLALGEGGRAALVAGLHAVTMLVVSLAAAELGLRLA